MSVLKYNSDDEYIVILFHEVTDKKNDTGLVRSSALPYKHSIKIFNKYINVLKENNVSTVLPEVHAKAGNEKRSLMLSFDDGGISNMYSADTLERNGYRGLFFVITKYINSKGFLSSNNIKDLVSRGHVVGSHSHTHPNIFTSLSTDEMGYEWKKSKATLEDIIGSEVNICSVPSGDVSMITYESAHNSGYRFLFDSEPILKLRKYKNLNIYGRFCLKTSHSPDILNNWINNKGLHVYKITWDTKKTIKKILFPLYKFKRQFDQHNEK